jgi:hypothetical protein
MVFDFELISSFINDSYKGLSLLPGLWLSDVGLLFPIAIALVYSKKIHISRYKIRISRLSMSRGLIIYVLVVVYGLLMGLVRGNEFSEITVDLRTCLALISGVALSTIVPRKPQALAASIIVTAAIAVFLSILIDLRSPIMQLQAYIPGIGDPNAFRVIGLSICLLAPGMILSRLYGNRPLFLLAWMSACGALVLALVIVHTRTLSFAFALSVMLAVVVLLAFARVSGSSTHDHNVRGFKTRDVFILGIILLGVFIWQRESIAVFISRMQDINNLGNDINWVARLDEVNQAFKPMTVLDHIVGMGFGIKTQNITATGDVAIVLHIAILNAWWRLGILSFMVLVGLILILLLRFLRSLFRILGRPSINKITNKTIALLVVAPGVLTLVFLTCFSGGWSISTMLSLGILYGGYRRLMSAEMLKMTL